MRLPFTGEQFFEVFAFYNRGVWPAQPVLLALGLAALGLVFVRRAWTGPAVSLILALLWAWLAVVYHGIYFAAINPLARLFAAVSLAGALLFVWHGVVRRRLHFAWPAGWRGPAGAALVVFALAVYPAWSSAAGHGYPEMPTFGLPCPTTIFTLGLLAWLVRPHPRGPLVVPTLWCAVGMQAALLLGVLQDLGLVAAGAVGVALWVTARSAPEPASV